MELVILFFISVLVGVGISQIAQLIRIKYGKGIAIITGVILLIIYPIAISFI